MVLTNKVGTERSFPIVALLYGATLGLYGIYWHYKVQNELYKQFELHREQRDEGALWLLYGRTVFRPLFWVFLFVFVDNLHHVRARFGLQERPRTGYVLTFSIIGTICAYLGLGLLYFAFYLAFGEDPNMSVDEVRALATGIFLLSALALALGGALLAMVYAPLQKAVNEVWQAYDARMEALMPGGATGGASGAWYDQVGGPSQDFQGRDEWIPVQEGTPPTYPRR